MTNRAYSWSCIIYHTEDTIKKFLEKDIVSKYAYILHDHDKSNLHYHLVVVFKQNVSLHFIQKNLDLLAGFHQNTFGESVVDRIGIFEYLTHSELENDKYHYDEKCVITNARDYFSGITELKDNVSYQLLCDIISNRPFRELAKNYGREVILNYSKYRDYADLVISQEKRIVVSVQEELPFD